MNAITTATVEVTEAAQADVIKPCACMRFDHLAHRCNRTTKRIFAPGHDARIKGFLQSAKRDGEEVLLDGQWVTPRMAAEEIAPALVAFLYYRRGTMSARFADDEAALADSAVSMQIKVGRWIYNALVAGDTVIYVTKSGETKTLPIADANFVSKPAEGDEF